MNASPAWHASTLATSSIKNNCHSFAGAFTLDDQSIIVQNSKQKWEEFVITSIHTYIQILFGEGRDLKTATGHCIFDIVHPIHRPFAVIHV